MINRKEVFLVEEGGVLSPMATICSTLLVPSLCRNILMSGVVYEMMLYIQHGPETLVVCNHFNDVGKKYQ